MIENLKKELQKDFWKIINGEEIEEKKDDIFLNYIFYLFLEKKSFLMDEVFKEAKILKRKYYKLMNNFDTLLEENYGQIIDVLKSVNEKYDSEMTPIMNKIEMIKNGRQKQSTRST